MDKVTFLIRREFVRTFVDSGVLRATAQQIPLNVCVTDNALSLPVEFERVGAFAPVKKLALRVAQFEHDLYSWHFRKRSTSIAFRVKQANPPLSRLVRTHLPALGEAAAVRDRSENTYDSDDRIAVTRRKRISFLATAISIASKTAALLIRWFYRKFARQSLLRLLATNALFPLASKVLGSYLDFEARDLAKQMKSLQIKHIALPSGGLDPFVALCIRAASQAEIFTSLLADNWDQMGGKGSFPERPDQLIVIGSQSAEFATKVHAFPQSSVHTVGCATYESYGPSKTYKYPKGRSNRRYILFIGTALPANEIDLLLRLQSVMDENAAEFEDMSILYRPHPLKQSLDPLSHPGFHRVFLDSQIDNNLGKNFVESRGIGSTYSLQHLPPLIVNSEFVISGLSSMLLETALLGKNTLVIAHEETRNPTSPARVYENYIHLHGIERLPNTLVSLRNAEYERNILAMLARRSARQKDIDRELEYFLKLPPDLYSSRLAQAFRADRA